MRIKSKIKNFAFKNKIWIEKLESNKDILKFLKRFREKFISCDLVRVGGEGDGGYLHPNILDRVSFCYSPGVSSIANFEKELSDVYGIKSFMADASVKKSPIQDKNLEFIPKFIGTHSDDKFITLSDWISGTIGNSNKNTILQMDIEGNEYSVLMFEDSSTLAKFSTMTIEFHNLQKIFKKDFLIMFSTIFEKIYKNFSICHVHPNNCCGIVSLNGIDVPRVIEVTFIRNDLVKSVMIDKPIKLPHNLDRKNIESKENISMPKLWWKK